MAYTFDGANKLIILSTGTTSVDIHDLWSRWVDWWLLTDNSKYLPAFESIGGDDIDAVAGTRVPIYSRLGNGWKIRPQEANHVLTLVNGILLTDDSSSPFVSTVGVWTVQIIYQQPVQAVTSGLSVTQNAKLSFIDLYAKSQIINSARL